MNFYVTRPSAPQIRPAGQTTTPSSGAATVAKVILVGMFGVGAYAFGFMTGQDLTVSRLRERGHRI